MPGQTVSNRALTSACSCRWRLIDYLRARQPGATAADAQDVRATVRFRTFLAHLNECANNKVSIDTMNQLSTPYRMSQ